MPHSSCLAEEILKELITIERTLWENNAEIYQGRYSPEAFLIFPGVGRIDRDTAVAAIRKENAEGHAWAEVRFDDVDGRWITTDAAALITYMATARWNYESSASKTLCASVYVRAGGSWRVAFHQQTPI
jgi:transglutaminase-like putative cysteine protease